MIIGQVKGNPDVATASIVAKRYTDGPSQLHNDALIARSITFQGGSIDFTLFNTTGFASGIPTQGPLTFMDWYNVMPFADSVVTATVTGRQLKEILTSNAKRIVRPREQTGTNSLQLSGYISRGFLHFSKGIRYAVKLGSSATVATAADIQLNGSPIEQVLDKTFRLGMNSYIAAGGYGENWNGNPIGANVPGSIKGYDLKSLNKLDTGFVYRNAVIAFIKETAEVSPQYGCVLDGRLKIIA